MLDPIQHLSAVIYSNKGIYALLLGSGVSRSSGIPTGWEIVKDLIARLAKLKEQDARPDPIAWYRREFGEEPSYSRLLQALSNTSSERCNLLRAYFEANEEEREEGLKLSTKGHRAIAQLVVKGYIRVVITTNFDRLLENAIADAGLPPHVISSEDDLLGAPPLEHARCMIIKVNGDYLDDRLRNTETELDQYDPELTDTVGRIFQNFGLIVCGWSSKWDVALREMLLSVTSRGYGLYWTKVGSLDDHSGEIVSRTNATGIDITDADSFFDTLAENIIALEEQRLVRDVSPQMLISRAKRYLEKEGEHRIRLQDLLVGEARATQRRMLSLATHKIALPDRLDTLQDASSSLVDLFFATPIGGARRPRTLCQWSSNSCQQPMNRICMVTLGETIG